MKVNPALIIIAPVLCGVDSLLEKHFIYRSCWSEPIPKLFPQLDL